LNLPKLIDFAFFTLCLCLVGEYAHAQKIAREFVACEPLPTRWHFPRENELSDEWRQRIPGRAAFFESDMNGDGVADQIALGLRNDGTAEGLFVKLSGDKNSWKLIYKIPSTREQKLFMGIKELTPGNYRVVCVDDEACGKDGKRKIAVSSFLISYFRPGSSGALIYWDVAWQRWVTRWDSN
jgi:hypothetical protein